MGAAPGSGWEEGEFEFKLVFEEDPPRQSRCGPEDTDIGQTHREPAGMSGPRKDGKGGYTYWDGARRSGLVTDVLGLKTAKRNI